ncbi:MAG: M3 family metallopeptidase [Lysobacterales bacterium]
MKTTLSLALGTALALILSGCSDTDTSQVAESVPEAPTETVMTTDPAENNPFFVESPLYMHYPQFDKIKNEHYLPAFERGMEEQLAEIDAITNQAEAPTFDNTLIPMEESGQLLNRAARVFFAMTSANTNDELESIRSEMAPKFSAHNDKIRLNAELFARIQALYDERDTLELDPESYRLIEETHKDFVRAGAQLSDADKETLKAMNAELASLQTQFSQNVLNEVNASAVVVDSREELEGMSETSIEAAAEAAKEKDMEGKYLIALLNTSQQPPLTDLKDRALRQRIMEASLARGSRGGEFDNREILTRVVKIRAERAQLMGYPNHAAYGLENQTARTTEAVNERLASLAPPAAANAKREAADIQAIIDAEGGDFQLASWDWNFYAEKVRMQRYNFDAAQLRPYFEMNNVLEKGVFYAAEQVFGITFKERKDLPVYQEDVRVFEVFEADGSTLALFLMDPYARPSKRGGAWMNAYVSQSLLMENKPVVANHLNITKPTSADEPTLMTFDEVTTMFHEFGHALHGMFSNVKYPEFSGTSVPRDFVEYPSQVNEMWSTWPTILENYAVHYETGEPMPQELLEKVLETRKFNQGYSTTEYLAASLLDQKWHQLTPEDVPTAEGLLDFEHTTLQEAGVALDTVPPRYRSTYFSHIVGGYSAGYYAYIWSEVLDADTVEWFKENGGLTRENGDHFRQTLLSRGGAEDAMTLFKNFRGAEPDIQPLLDRRGLN